MAQLEQSRFVVLENGAPTHKLSEHKTYEEVKDEDSLAILVDAPYVVLDFDSMDQFNVMKQIVKDKHLNTRIMASTRGGHIWFKSDIPLKNNVDINTPLTLHVDVRSHGKYSYVKVKENGVWREWLTFDEEVDTLPEYLKPIHHDVELFRMKNSDGRNSTLFSYIITLTSAGLSKETIRDTFKLINDYIFDDKLSSSELNTILRDEAFDNLRPAFFDKSTFLHHIFGDYIANNNYIYTYNNRLYMYKDGWYTQDTTIIEAKMIEYIPNLTQHQRREVLSYLLLKAEPLPDINPYMIACTNGSIDIRDKKLREHSPTDFVRNKINTRYDENAYVEVVDEVLDKISANDPQLRKLLEEMMGYALIPTSKFQKAFILYGDGANGKSTLLDILTEVIGDTNISSLSLQELNHNFKLSEITNKLVNIGDDISDQYLEDSSIFKKLVSGDEVTVDKKNEQPYKMRNYATMLFATNNLPTTKDKSAGYSRRLSIIPFEAVFSSTDPDYDPFILDKLTTPEAKSYILNLAIDGIIRVFAQNGFTEVDRVDDILNDFLKENNNVIAFLSEFDIEGQVSSDAYNEYTYWCAQNGVSNYKIRKFNSEVRKNSDMDTVIERVGGQSSQVWRKKDCK